MPPRFYCPTLTSTGRITLPETESHHLMHVLRLASGAPVELFNGRGLVGQGAVAAVRKREVDCEVTATTQESIPSPELILATAVPKGERFDWLVEKAAELGVSRLIPLQTARSTVDPRDTKLERLRQTVIAACKQSRRPHLMEVAAVTEWRSLLDQFRSQRWLIADPHGKPLCNLDVRTNDRPGVSAWVACIGPEGGFTAEELAMAQERGGQLISLGGPLLRIETAGIAMATWGLLQRMANGTVSTAS